MAATSAAGQIAASKAALRYPVLERLPASLAGMSLERLRDDCHNRLFNQYLPFWDKGGYDTQFGGFMCELNDDGSVFDDKKYIWYQGRAIWVYSFLYNNLDRDPRWLKIARKTKDFMIRHMHAGGGKWYDTVRRDGTLIDGVGKAVYGALFAANGLAEYYKATGEPDALKLAKQSIWTSVRRYDAPNHDHGEVGHISIEVPTKGLRMQGYSMVFLRTLSQMLSHHEDPELEKLCREHVDALVNRFWNSEYGIANECLNHDYSRIPGNEGHMFAGHSLEALWMVMHEALRIKDRELFDLCKRRIRRLLEMCWDYVFEGWADEDYFIFNTAQHRRGPKYEMKTMWAHCEILVACMSVLEYTGEVWAREWYERVRAYTLRTMPVAEDGVWRQAVDRRGRDLQRPDISTKRKGNYHQPRMLMLNLQALNRMIANRGNLTPFPE